WLREIVDAAALHQLAEQADVDLLRALQHRVDLLSGSGPFASAIVTRRTIHGQDGGGTWRRRLWSPIVSASPLGPNRVLLAPPRLEGVAHADEGRERAADEGGPGDARRRDAPALLVAGGVRGGPGRASDPRAAAGRGPGAVPRW